MTGAAFTYLQVHQNSFDRVVSRAKAGRHATLANTIGIFILHFLPIAS